MGVLWGLGYPGSNLTTRTVQVHFCAIFWRKAAIYSIAEAVWSVTTASPANDRAS